jgi:hypothetical protein
MKDNLTRLIFCFAALDLSDDELRRLVKGLRMMQWEEIKLRVILIRQDALHYQINEDKQSRKKKRSKLQSYDASVGERVEQLLKIEANLTNSQAVEKLASRLNEMGMIEQQDMPSISRKTLRSWVNQLLKKVPAKDILRCATILRNEYVHSPISDWKLKTTEK